jgi:type II secretory pathway component GspD/PulD (secretin)
MASRAVDRLLLSSVAVACLLASAHLFAQENDQEAQGDTPQPVDYTVLAEPTFANRLALTDQQRAAVAQILDERVTALVAAKAGERAEIVAASNQRLAELLTDAQKASLGDLSRGGTLRFNFRQEKWASVLDWFSRQSELSLVMDTEPPGVFTYSDNKDYSPVQAVDLLNSVLLSKGFTLMRREQMLIVVDVSKGIPFELAEKISAAQLDDRGRFEIVTVEFSLGGRSMDSCLEAVKELIGTHGRVTPLTGAGKLLVTETAGKLRVINQVIAAVPVPSKPAKPKPAPEPVFTTYPITGLDATATLETLQGLFSSATIKADPTAQELHVYAVPNVQTSVESSIGKMVANASGDNKRRLHVYAVNPQQLATLPTHLGTTVPKAQVTVDEAGKRLLVVATQNEHADIEQTLTTLGASVGADASEAVVTIYSVEPDDGDALTELLRQVVPRGIIISQSGRIAVRASAAEQQLAKMTIDEFQKAGPDKQLSILKIVTVGPQLDTAVVAAIQTTVPEATLTLLADGKRLSVLGRAEDQALVATAIEQVTGDLPQPEIRQLQTYPVGRLAASEAQTLLTAIVPDATLRVDPSGTRLIALATPTEHAAMSKTLSQIEEEPPVEAPTLEIYPVDETEASSTLSAVQALAPSIRANLDSSSRRLVVIAKAEEHQLVAALVSKLKLDAVPQHVLIGYSLQKADPAVVVSMLQELQPKFRFAADTRSNRILVTAPLGEQPRLKAIIEQLDAPQAANQELVVKPYTLNSMTPTVVQQVLQPMFAEMTITADGAANRLLVKGKEIDHQRFTQLIDRLDKNDDVEAGVTTYDIGTADADQVRNVLMQLVPAAVISTDPTARRIMVWANSKEQAVIRTAIEQFTQARPDQEKQLMSYPLPSGTSSTAMTIATSVAADAMLTVSDNGEHLIVWGVSSDQAAIERVLMGLADPQFQDQKLVFRSHEASPAVLAAAAMLLTEVAPHSQQITTDSEGKWLIWAPEDEQEVIAKLLGDLESEVAAKVDDRKIQTYDVQDVDASILQRMMTDKIPTATVLDSSDSRRLLVLAAAVDHEKVAELLAELAPLFPAAPKMDVQVYQVDKKRTSAADLLALLPGELTAAGEIQVNSSSNTLIVRASKERHEQLQQAIETLVSKLPEAPSANTRVFRFESGLPSEAATVLATLVPAAKLAANNTSMTLAATGTAAELEEIERVVEQLQSSPQINGATTRVYRLRKASAKTVSSTFLQLVPTANVAYDATAQAVVATASPAQHELFQATVELIDGQQIETVLRVYPIDRQHLSVETVEEALDPDLKASVSIQISEAANSLIIRADEATHETVKAAIETIVEQLPASQRPVTKAYPLKSASAEIVAKTLRPLVPDAAVYGDDQSRSLFVTAGDDTQAEVAAIVERLDTVPSDRPIIKAYPVRAADANAVYDTVKSAFSGSGDFSVTFQPATRTLFVVASEENQEVFEGLMAELDKPGPPHTPKFARLYPLLNVDGEAATSALTTLFGNQQVQVKYNKNGNALIVIGTDKQHSAVQKSLAGMEGAPREFAVFTLQQVDPYVVENAVYELFTEVPDAAAPSISSDYESQRVFVRGTVTQIEKIRTLLAKLGEAVDDGTGEPQRGGVRTIPFRGDTEEAVRQVERIWGQLRLNRIEVVTPGERKVPAPQPPPGNLPPNGKSDEKRPEGAVPEGVVPEGVVPEGVVPGESRRQLPSNLQFVGAPPANQLAKSQPSDEAAKPQAAQEAQETDRQDKEKPPVVIVPERGKITIASPDHEALDELERLFRAMAKRVGPTSGSDLSVFLIQNTDASEMQDLLDDLFDEMPRSRRGSGGIAIVTDRRLNALVVHGSQRDREMIEELLAVLDTAELPDPRAVPRPRLVALHTAQAQRVVGILRNVYSAQLKSGGREKLTIPSGVSPEVALILQQFNAAAAGPLLTLDVDEVSNAIVLRAPPELSEEIEEFIETLDRPSGEGAGRRVRVIQLKRSKADRVESMLRELLLNK